jgi:hemerythrin-like domain-containing protein
MHEVGKEYVQSLREDHARFSRVLSMIGRDARRLIDEPEEVLSLFNEAVDYVVNFQNVYHHPREEIMFAKLAESDPSLRETAMNLKKEHGGVGIAGKSIQALLNRAASDLTSKESRKRLSQKLEQFATEMRTHIRQEEELLYSRVWDELQDGDWEEIADKAPPTDPLGESQSKRYPLLARYVAGGSGESIVSMPSSSLLQDMEVRLDRILSKSPRLTAIKSIARRHGEEAVALGRRSREALPDRPLRSPVGSASVGAHTVCKLGAAYGRWIRDWHRYVWYQEMPHAEKGA